MNDNIQKFIDTIQSDEALQEKLTAAGKVYDGDQTAEAVFDKLIAPVAKDAGYNFNWDDFKEYINNETKKLDLDEMEMVAGGDGPDMLAAGGNNKDENGGGVGATACAGVGIGVGTAVVEVKDDLTHFGACVAVGIGYKTVMCMAEGKK